MIIQEICLHKVVFSYCNKHEDIGFILDIDLEDKYVAYLVYPYYPLSPSQADYYQRFENEDIGKALEFVKNPKGELAELDTMWLKNDADDDTLWSRTDKLCTAYGDDIKTDYIRYYTPTA